MNSEVNTRIGAKIVFDCCMKGRLFVGSPRTLTWPGHWRASATASRAVCGKSFGMATTSSAGSPTCAGVSRAAIRALRVGVLDEITRSITSPVPPDNVLCLAASGLNPAPATGIRAFRGRVHYLAQAVSRVVTTCAELRVSQRLRRASSATTALGTGFWRVGNLAGRAGTHCLSSSSGTPYAVLAGKYGLSP